MSASTPPAVPGFAPIPGGNLNPIPLDRADRLLRVLRGPVDVFVIEDGRLDRRRHHLFRLAEGSVLLGIDPPDRPHCGPLVVGSLDSAFEPLDAEVALDQRAFEPWIVALAEATDPPTEGLTTRRAAAGTIDLADGEVLGADPRHLLWLTVAEGTARFVHGDETIGPGDRLPLIGALALRAEGGLRGRLEAVERVRAADLASFHRLCLAIVDRRVRARTAARAAPETREWRAEARRGAVERLAALAGAAGTASGTAVDFHDPLRVAVARIFEALAVPIDRRAFDLAGPETGSDDERLARLLTRHHAIARPVLLRDGWENHAATPLLARRGAEEHPVALLPRRDRWHVVSDDGEEIVDETPPTGLHPDALQIYPGLPDAALGFRDLLSFGVRRLGRDGLRVVAWLLAAGILATLVPFGSKLLVDTAIPSGDVGMIAAIVGGLLVTTLATTAFELTRTLALRRAETALDLRLQPALFARLLRLPTPFFRGWSVGDVAGRLIGIQQAREIVSATTIGAVASSIFALVSLVPIVLVDKRIGAVVFALSLALAAITALFTLGQLRHERRLGAAKGRLDGFVVQMLTGIAKLKAAAVEDVAFARWADGFRRTIGEHLRAERWANGQATAQAILPHVASMTVYALILWWMKADAVAAAQADPTQGAPAPFSAGDFVAVSAGFAQVVGAVTGLATALTRSLSALPLIERAAPLLATAPDPLPPSQAPKRIAGAIEIRDLSFRYTPKSPLALDRVGLSIHKGEFVAIVGASGSGKSTLMRLLLGFERPESGDVFYDGTSIGRLDLAHLRRQIGVVLQHGRLTSGSIQANIVGPSGLGMEEALAAARLVGLEADIEAMPMGMHTVLLDGGATLSGGQRQRILIARALVAQPSILLLDEATSALDNRTQAIVTETLSKLAVTRVVIAHRLSTIEAVDRVIVLDRGRIAETGTFRELMDGNGLFAAHARRQLV